MNVQEGLTSVPGELAVSTDREVTAARAQRDLEELMEFVKVYNSMLVGMCFVSVFFFFLSSNISVEPCHFICLLILT